jgi:hypothetical protein
MKMAMTYKDLRNAILPREINNCPNRIVPLQNMNRGL